MSSTIQKEWAALDGDEIVEKADTKAELREKVDTSQYEVCALPKPHYSMIL